MRVYQPKCKITLVKSRRRAETVPSKPADAERYGRLSSIDLTPFLMTEGASLTTTKSVREPAGSFVLNLPDQPSKAAHLSPKTGGFTESLYALVEPMDYVEIRLAHNPGEYLAGKYGIVMRGFVSSVTRNEDLSSGSPRRFVTIAGQDFGKIWQIIQIYYLNNSVLGEYNLSLLEFFHKWTEDGEAKIVSADDFIASVIDRVMDPFLGSLVALATPPTGGAVINSFQPRANIKGYVSPYRLASFRDVSLHNLLSQVLDVGPFNELYTADEEDGVYLVARPIPFKSASTGQFIQSGAWADSLSVSSSDVQSLNVSRSDASVANFFVVTGNAWFTGQNQTVNELLSVGNPADFALFDYLNTDQRYYGFRKMEVDTWLVPQGYLASDAVKVERIAEQGTLLSDFLVARRKTLADLNKDAIALESGQMVLRGNEKIKPGTLLTVKRGGPQAEAMEVYAHTVQHDFVPQNGNFKTTVSFDNGTGWIWRAGDKAARYNTEIDAGGSLPIKGVGNA